MTVYLVRHGHAGSRGKWQLADDLRPLSAKGVGQARALAAALAGQPLDRVLSSRYVRCVQTVELLATDHGLPVEEVDALAEEASPADVLALVSTAAKEHTALCTHGNLVPVVLDALKHRGVPFASKPHTWEKGSTWVLDTEDGEVTGARYLPPGRAPGA